MKKQWKQSKNGCEISYFYTGSDKYWIKIFIIDLYWNFRIGIKGTNINFYCKDKGWKSLQIAKNKAISSMYDLEEKDQFKNLENRKT